MRHDGTVGDSSRPLIVFDGVCHLCNGFVQFVLTRDAAAAFDFTPLQSEIARQHLRDLASDSIALIEGIEEYRAEDAVLRILARLRAPWPQIARFAGFLPRPLLAWGYRLIARHRYTLFGRYDRCMLPKSEWKDRFLT